MSLLIDNINIGKSIDSVMDFFKLNPSDREFLVGCSKPGQGVLVVGYPYATTYHLQRIPSELEAQILFGKQERVTAFSFVHPVLEAFAKEQGVIMSDWVQGDTTLLRNERVTEWTQKAIGIGKVFAYIDKKIINGDLIMNQSKEHYLSIIQVAGHFIQRNRPVEVNHFEDADLTVQLEDGPVAFEYQISNAAGNDVKRLMEKRKHCEHKYGRMYFIGNAQSVKEVSQAIGTDKIVVSRGRPLENLINNHNFINHY